MNKDVEAVDLARSQREKQAHDQGIDRVTYNRVLRNAGAYYADKRTARIAELFAGHDGGSFLELGSSCWKHWIEATGVAPGSLTCINISQTELGKGEDAAAGSRVRPQFRLMDANNLEFADASFDVVYGGGILHHLQFERALAEVLRVLKPGGLMLFEEPLDINPVGTLVRWFTPRARTADEHPLRRRELRLCAERFHMQSTYLQLSSVPAGVLSGILGLPAKNLMTRWAFGFDEWLLRVMPAAGMFYRYVLLVGRK